jgi:hypothetical protein
MKFIANRERDLEHLSLMRVTADEKVWVSKYLDVLAERYPQGRFPEHAGKIANAKQYVDAWETENEL